jgi:hypothetical protein
MKYRQDSFEMFTVSVLEKNRTRLEDEETTDEERIPQLGHAPIRISLA